MTDDMILLLTVVADDTTADVVVQAMPYQTGETGAAWARGVTVPSPGPTGEDRAAWVQELLVAVIEAL